MFCPKPREQEVVRRLSRPVHRPFPSFPIKGHAFLLRLSPPSLVPPTPRAPGVGLTDRCIYMCSSNHNTLSTQVLVSSYSGTEAWKGDMVCPQITH